MPDHSDHSGGRGCCGQSQHATGWDITGRYARRRQLKAAVFPPRGPAADEQFTNPDVLPRAIWGTLLDVSPQVLVIRHGSAERRLILSADATAWRGGRLEPAALTPGDHVVVRIRIGRQAVADRVWANMGRVTGTIMERSGQRLTVSEGATRKRRVVIIPAQAAGRILVRFPNLQPGFLIDVIGMRRGEALEALVPATSQPTYRADQLPRPPLVTSRGPGAVSGSATWHEPADEAPGLLGAAYPAIDPDAGCAEAGAGGGLAGPARLPYLAIGSILHVRNDCAGTSCLLPVTGCAPAAQLFNDRCVTCDTSPRGRVADLSLASFIALGGEPELGCFNATVTIGR
jgi:hypothetical protein